jgi:transposase
MPAPNKFAVGNKGGGRYSQLNPNFIRRAELACRAGFTDGELAELFDVSLATIQKWKRQIGEIRTVNENNKKHPGGRPNKFKPEYIEQARKICQFGHTDPELAEFFGVHLQTINNWKRKYPEFLYALKAGKEAANARVERSLYERGLGYNYDAVKVFMPAGSKQPVVVHYQEHVPADVGAAFIWLKNRDPDRWRDVQNVEHVLGKYIISDKPMTLEEWASARATVVNEVIDDSVTPEIPQGIEHRKKGP